MVHGSDGTPHGHGGWELDPEDWEVSESQYRHISKAVEEGEYDLIKMHVRGLVRKCNEILKEQEYFAQLRGDDPENSRVYITVVDINPEIGEED